MNGNEMNDLDLEISGAFSLLGVLLVFVIAYFSAILPDINELLGRPAPEVNADRRSLAARLRTYRSLTVGLLLVVAAVLTLLVPLSRRVLKSLSFTGPFQTIRAGLLFIDFLLIAMALVAGWLFARLSRRIDDFREAE